VIVADLSNLFEVPRRSAGRSLVVDNGESFDVFLSLEEVFNLRRSDRLTPFNWNLDAFSAKSGDGVSEPLAEDSVDRNSNLVPVGENVPVPDAVRTNTSPLVSKANFRLSSILL
jgi:hypothetical protein